MATQFDTSALQRILSPLASTLDRTSLESLIAYRADPQTQERVDQLAEKCNAGTLTAHEEREYESYVESARFIAVLKAEAKRILESQDAA